MTVLSFYLLCAVTTGLVAVYELFWPVISSLRITHPELMVVTHWRISVVTFFLMSVLIAPLIISSCVVPSMGARFRSALAVNLEKTQ
jgi:hypothetical protein